MLVLLTLATVSVLELCSRFVVQNAVEFAMASIKIAAFVDADANADAGANANADTGADDTDANADADTDANADAGADD